MAMAPAFSFSEMMSLAMWPEQPLRSSGSSGSGTAFDALHGSLEQLDVAVGGLHGVQKQVRPEVSAAPSISTPFLPPSLKALATTFSERPAASAASFLGNVCEFGIKRRDGKASADDAFDRRAAVRRARVTAGDGGIEAARGVRGRRARRGTASKTRHRAKRASSTRDREWNRASRAPATVRWLDLSRRAQRGPDRRA